MTFGGRFGYDDDGETPNTQVVLFDYEAAPFAFEVRGLPAAAGAETMDEYHGASIGVVVTCEGGRVVVANRTITVLDRAGRQIREFRPDSTRSANHYANFIGAVRERDPSALAVSIEEGHRSSALSHTANISHRLGRTVLAQSVQDELAPGSVLGDAFSRMKAHLEANRVDLTTTPIVQGASLSFDPANERFFDSDEANALLTRDYRPPFVVPSV